MSMKTIIQRPGRTARGALLMGFSFILLSCAGPQGRTGISPPAQGAPPAGLAPEQTPQFVCFSSDDNGFSGLSGSGSSGGLHYITELFGGRKNPAGSGSARTFDGAPIHYTFFVNTYYITPAGKENPVYVKRSWKEAIDRGHEIGVHTHSHPHGRDFSVAQWEEEIQRSIDFLTRPWDAAETPEHPNPSSGLGLSRAELRGFRAPFIEPSDNGMRAVSRMGFVYDSSLEEGILTGPDRVEFPWPYRLDPGRRANQPPIGSYPGLWEIPLYNFIVPPDSECPRYGIPAGLRDNLKKVQNYFDPRNGEITGADWNLWEEFSLTPREFVATLKYTLDRHLQDNRCPMTVALHSELYTEKRAEKDAPGVNITARRAALEEFLDYALGKPQVRVINHRELLDWLRRPAPLR
jgi:hypothetical protein